MTPEERADLLGRGMAPAIYAAEMPDVPAVVSAEGDRTWAELNTRANQLVRALRAGGLGAGDGVAVMCANRPEWVEVYTAVMRAGLRLTPINWHLTGEEAAYIVDNCEAKAFLADARFAAAAADAVAHAPACRVRLAVGGPIEGFADYQVTLAGMDPGDIPDPQLGSTMLYTSGTTGRPKGVHRSDSGARLAAVTSASGGVAGYKAGEHVHLVTGPLYHAAPLAISMAAPLAAGVTLVLMDGWEAEETLRLIGQHRVTHTHLVPTMMHRLLGLPDDVRGRYDVSTVGFVLHGAAPCPVEVKRRMMEWWGPVVHEYYAATEGGGTFITGAQWLEKPGSVGRPGPGQAIRIFDENGDDCATGEIGTVYMKAPDSGRFEYYKDPDKTASAYLGDWFTLGDMGYVDDDGFLFLTDRSANLIISGGVNIYPAEIDAVLLEHPVVFDVATIGVPDEDWGEAVKAVVQVRDGVEGSDDLAAELIAFCRERLARYKCPRSVGFMAELPRSDTGKIYKRLLRDRYREAGVKHQPTGGMGGHGPPKESEAPGGRGPGPPFRTSDARSVGSE